MFDKFPKTKDTFKNELLPALAKALPILRSKSKPDPVAERLSDIEAVQDVILKKMEDTMQYSAAFDIYHQMSPSSVSYNVLEQLYGRDLNFLRQYYQICSPIDQLIFQKKFEQFHAVADCVADDPNKVGWRVVHKLHGSPNYKESPKDKQKCRWFELLIQNANKQRHPGGFHDAGIAMLESKMLFDRIPIEKIKHVNQKQYGNLPASYLIPDAATIKPTTWVLHSMAGASGYSGRSPYEQAKSVAIETQQTARNLIGYEIQAKDIAQQLVNKGKAISVQTEVERLTTGIIQWVQQMPDKQIATGYTEYDISVFIGNPSPQLNTWGWSSGSAFERSFAFGEVIFKMTGYNHEIFDSRMPEAVLAISKAGADKRQKQQLHERMNDEGADRFSNLLVQYVNDPDKDIKLTKLKDKPKEMQFKEMFILYAKLKCAAYGLDYTILNLEDGKSGGLGGSGAHEKRMEAQLATGIRSDTRYIAHCLTEALIAPWSPDFRMEFVHDVSETEDDVKLKKEKMSYKSLHETRMEDNLEEEWWNEAPKEFRDELKTYGKFAYLPGITDQGRVQLITKQMDLDMQKQMQEQAASQEQQGQDQGQGQPVTDQQDQGLQENPEITNLKSAIGQVKGQSTDLGKSFAIKVEHHYLN